MVPNVIFSVQRSIDGGWPRNGSDVGPQAELIAYHGDQQFIMVYQYLASLTLTLETYRLVASSTPTLAYIVPPSRLLLPADFREQMVRAKELGPTREMDAIPAPPLVKRGDASQGSGQMASASPVIFGSTGQQDGRRRGR